MSSKVPLDVCCISCCGGAIWWTLTKETQAWCYLQVKLSDPYLSALCVPWCKKALYKYSSFTFLSGSRMENGRLEETKIRSSWLSVRLYAFAAAWVYKRIDDVVTAQFWVVQDNLISTSALRDVHGAGLQSEPCRPPGILRRWVLNGDSARGINHRYLNGLVGRYVAARKETTTPRDKRPVIK